MPEPADRSAKYEASSITLPGAVAMGTGVMIGAGILALTGQMAELAGELYLPAFAGAAVVAGFSAYSYVRLAAAYPSAGGVAMFLEKAYGKTAWTGAFALLMYFSMVLNESLVARTFGTYALQPFDIGPDSPLVSVLGVGLLAFAFLVNLLRNELIQTTSFVTAVLKIGGLLVIGVVILWAAGVSLPAPASGADQPGIGGFLGAVALGVLAYKGFTTITNSGAEITEPRKNIGRAIVIAIALCFGLYLLVALAVGSALSVDEIIAARDYALAQAARPVLGDAGLWFTVAFAVTATASGVVASVFAVSRMLAMLTEMKLVPHSHFGMPGTIQHHTLVYTIVLAASLTVFLDLSRIAAVGAVLYIVMDMAVHWGLLRRLRDDVTARRWVVAGALLLDGVVLAALGVVKASDDPLVVAISAAGLIAIFAGEWAFLKLRSVD